MRSILDQLTTLKRWGVDPQPLPSSLADLDVSNEQDILLFPKSRIGLEKWFEGADGHSPFDHQSWTIKGMRAALALDDLVARKGRPLTAEELEKANIGSFAVVDSVSGEDAPNYSTDQWHTVRTQSVTHCCWANTTYACQLASARSSM